MAGKWNTQSCLTAHIQYATLFSYPRKEVHIYEQNVLACHLCYVPSIFYAVFRASRGKRHTVRKYNTALPKAQLASGVSPKCIHAESYLKEQHESTRMGSATDDERARTARSGGPGGRGGAEGRVRGHLRLGAERLPRA